MSEHPELVVPEAESPLTDPASPIDPEGKKSKKKKRKKEEKRRLAFLERFPTSPPQIDAGQPVQAQLSAKDPETSSGKRLREWLRPAARTLNNQQIVAAQKSSAVIAVNCLMLSLAAVAAFRTQDPAAASWALVPLALTNLFSLVFAILSARVDANSTLDALCAQPEDDFEDALSAIIQSKLHLYGALRRDLHLLGTELGRCQQHQRTAYNILLGGLPLSAVMFVICLALTAKT